MNGEIGFNQASDESKLIRDQKDMDSLNEWFHNRPFNLNLLYRGSEHGFTSS